MKRLLFFLLFLSSKGFVYSQESPRVIGQLIVQAKSESDLDKIVKQLSVVNNKKTELRVIKELSSIMHAYLLGFNEASFSASILVRELNRKPEVSIVQFNHLVNLRETLPNDPNFSSQWHHVNDGSGVAIEDADIDSDLAWDITTGGLTALNDTIVVCVIEGGNLEHTDLQENAWKNYGEIPNNDIDDDLNGYVDDFLGWNVQSNNDQGLFGDDHGTKVMGMIGAKGDNNLLVSGINWSVKIMAVGGENSNDEASVIEAYNYPLVMRKLYNETNGIKGAFVVATNASWGINYGDPASIPLWCAFYDTLGVNGILSCGATANSQINVDIDGDIPTGCESPYLISVTATNNQDIRTFSAYGLNTIDLGAPGENIITTYGNSSSGSTSGTSFASPLTAGVIGLLYAAPCASFMQTVKISPQLGADIVRNALLNGVDIVDDLIGYTVTGGRLNANNSLHEIIDNCSESICLGGYNLLLFQSIGSNYDLTWGIFNDSTTYNIRYKLISDSDWTSIYNINGNSFFIGDEEYRKYENISLSYCATYEFQLVSSCDSDYTGNIATLIFQTIGCCTAPDQLEIDPISSTSVSITWEDVYASTSFDLEFKETSELNYTLVEGITENNFIVNDLNPCSEYIIRIKSQCADSTSANYSTISFFTSGCGACDSLYCVSAAESSSLEFIQSVQIGDYINNSGNSGGYASFVNPGISLNKESAYPLILTPGFTNNEYNEFFSCWIDYNHDGDFSSTEMVFSVDSASINIINAEITIPPDALIGTTKLRVVMKYFSLGGNAQACEETFSYGEVEDYCIEILQAIGLNDDIKSNNFVSIFPNPANKSVVFSNLNKRNSIISTIIYDITGRMILTQNLGVGENTIDLSNFSDGLYSYQIKEKEVVLQKGTFTKVN
jgi:serine protease